LLRDMKVDDEIVSMKIIRGAENLVKNERAPAPAPAEEQQQQAE